MSDGGFDRGSAAGSAATDVRFVVGWHETPPESQAASHLDLMIEIPGADRLATWRIAGWGSLDSVNEAGSGGRSARLVNELVHDTSTNVSLATDATRIVDHAIDWLEREGPVSGGRGAFVRVVSGTGTLHGAGGDTRLEDRFTLIVDAVQRKQCKQAGKQGTEPSAAAPDWVDRLVAIEATCEDRAVTPGTWTMVWTYQVAE